MPLAEVAAHRVEEVASQETMAVEPMTAVATLEEVVPLAAEAPQLRVAGTEGMDVTEAVAPPAEMAAPQEQEGKEVMEVTEEEAETTASEVADAKLEAVTLKKVTAEMGTLEVAAMKKPEVVPKERGVVAKKLEVVEPTERKE